jgi:thiol-disulfide isomerase/thioredoxin
MSTVASIRWVVSYPHLRWLLCALLLGIGSLAAAQEPIPDADDLQRLGGKIRNDGTPLVLVVWAHDCPYCRVLDLQVLRPLQASGELAGRALLRKLDLDGAGLRDFDGLQVDGWSFADRYRAQLTPTVLFLDADGNELAERMVGINNVDFYPAYLDRAIDAAGKRLRAGDPPFSPRP